MDLVSIYSEKFITHKSLSFIEMDKAGMNIPRTMLINSKDITNIDFFIEDINSLHCSLSSYNYYSIRLSFSDIEYPHSFQAIFDKNNIYIGIKKLISQANKNRISSYDIICQPLVENTTWSGGIIKKDGNIYIELVYGCGKIIFRNGKYIYRYLHTEFSEYESFSNQTKFTYWHEGNLVESKLLNHNIIIKQDILKNIVHSILHIKFTDNRLYEFGIVNDEIILLESKILKNYSYNNLNKIFLEDEYSIVDKQENYEDYIFLDLPLLDYIGKLNYGSSVYINDGSIVSHLAFYCTQKKIPCNFKTHNKSNIYNYN